MSRKMQPSLSNAFIYGRYSSHAQNDASIEQQFESIYQFCQQYGIRVMGEYADRAISGRTDARPEFQRMIRDCTHGLVDYVVVWKVDRFARNRYDAAMYKAKLLNHGVRVLYAMESIPEGPEGILLESILEGSAEYYSANLAQNVRRGMLANAHQCKVCNGRLPFGYCKGPDGRYAVDTAHAAVVREAFAMYNAGILVTDICKHFNQLGIRTATGRPFSQNTLRAILHNERYTGVFIYDEVRIEGGVPALISRETFEMAQRRMARNAKAPAAAKGHTHFLLTGKLFCGLCGNPMSGSSGVSSGNKRPYYYYVCIGQKQKHICPKRPIRKDLIEEHIMEYTKIHILNDTMIRHIADSVVTAQKKARENGPLSALRKQLDEVNRSLGNLSKAIEQGIFSRTTQQRLQELEAQQEQLQQQITKTVQQQPLLSREHILYYLRQYQHGSFSDLDVQQKIVDLFVSAIYLYDDHISVVYTYSPNLSSTITYDQIQALELKSSYTAYSGEPNQSKTNFSEPIIMGSGEFVFVFPL